MSLNVSKCLAESLTLKESHQARNIQKVSSTKVRGEVIPNMAGAIQNTSEQTTKQVVICVEITPFSHDLPK